MDFEVFCNYLYRRVHLFWRYNILCGIVFISLRYFFMKVYSIFNFHTNIFGPGFFHRFSKSLKIVTLTPFLLYNYWRKPCCSISIFYDFPSFLEIKPLLNTKREIYSDMSDTFFEDWIDIKSQKYTKCQRTFYLKHFHSL